MSAELRRQYFIAGLEIPEDTEAIEEPDGTMDFYKDGAPQGDEEELNPLPSGDDYDYGLESEKNDDAKLGAVSAMTQAELAAWYDSLPALKVQGEVIVWPAEEDAAARGAAMAKLGAGPEVAAGAGAGAVDYKTVGAVIAATAALAGIALVGMRAHRARREQAEDEPLISVV